MPACGQAAVSPRDELLVGIDNAKSWQVATRFVPGKGVKPSEKMTVDTPLTRVAGWIKQGLKVHGVDETGPTGFALVRRLIALGATCMVVHPWSYGSPLDRLPRHRPTGRDVHQSRPGHSHKVANGPRVAFRPASATPR